jgi:predicted phage tail protein
MEHALEKNIDVVRGAGGGKGGGGGGARAAQEDPDSLRSIEYARVVDMISEGEIEGPVHGPSEWLKDIFLNDVPIQNDDGSYNFRGVAVDFRVGTQNQDHIPGFPSLESENLVGIEVKNTTPVVRTITNQNVDMVRVTLSTTGLTTQDITNGDLHGARVDFAIDVQTDGAGFVSQPLGDALAFNGKTTSHYQRQYLVNLPKPATEWDIRVRRITADNPPANVQNATFWDSYTEIIDTKLRYPNRAVFGLQVDASQFNSVPSRGYLIKGIRIKVPSNYDPVLRSYTGVWDGTFKVAWSDNPAWCYYDLLTNPRYGLGEFVSEDEVDIFQLYSIAQYCDQMVDNGLGDIEPRFTCNVYLQQREDAYRVLASMASVFRAMSYWSAGSITTVQDAPANAIALYGPANITGGQFSYSGSALKARHTVALVTWNDPDNRYRQIIEYVEDQAGIQRYGVVKTDVLAFGCTSRGQAHRWGQWLLYSERMETEICTFAVGLDGVLSPPGSVIHTSDPTRAGKRTAGRISPTVAITTSAIPLDAPVTLLAGKTYALSVMLPNGTLETQSVTDGPGTYSTLHVSPAFSQVPVNTAMWGLAQNDLQPEVWRVLSVSEQSQGLFQISAISHNPSKYDFVEDGVPLEPIPASIITLERPDIPTGLNVSDTQVELSPGMFGVKAHLSWDSPQRNIADSAGVFAEPNPGKAVARWIVGIRRHGEQWREYTSTEIGYDFVGIVSGDYDFYVIAVNSLGRRSETAYLIDEAFVGPSVGPPPAPTSFSGAGGVFQNTLQWTVATAGRTDMEHSEVWASNTNNRSTAVKLSDIMIPAGGGTYVQRYVHPGLQKGQTWYYWVRTVTFKQEPSAWTPVSATGGLQVITSDDPGVILDYLTGQITSSQLAASLADQIQSGTTGFDAGKQWQFDDGTEGGWAGNNATVLWQTGGNLRVTGTGVNPSIQQSSDFTDAINGGFYGVVRVRITRLAETGWAGKLFYRTAAHDFSNSFYKQLADPGIAVGESTMLEFDMTTLTAGGTDWKLSGITNLRLQLGAGAGDNFDIDWLAVGRFSPGASNAQIAEEQDIRTLQTGELYAQYTVKIDINGHVSGFGLASTAPVDGAPFSEFIIKADRFAIIDAGTPTLVPFVVSGGVVYLNELAVKDATITNAKIVSVNANKVVATNLAAITANLGAVTAAQLTLGSGTLDFIKSAGTGFGSGVPGYYLGFSGSQPVFWIGNPLGHYLYFDGNLHLNGQIIQNGNIVDNAVSSIQTATTANGNLQPTPTDILGMVHTFANSGKILIQAKTDIIIRSSGPGGIKVSGRVVNASTGQLGELGALHGAITNLGGSEDGSMSTFGVQLSAWMEYPTPGAGTVHTFTFRVQYENAPGASFLLEYRHPHMVIMELKK